MFQKKTFNPIKELCYNNTEGHEKRYLLIFYRYVTYLKFLRYLQVAFLAACRVNYLDVIDIFSCKLCNIEKEAFLFTYM